MIRQFNSYSLPSLVYLTLDLVTPPRKRNIIQNDYEATDIRPHAGGGVVEQGMSILQPWSCTIADGKMKDTDSDLR